MTGVRLGLRENLGQFGLLVLVNAFIVAFGISKALTNYLAGRCSDRFGRKPVLVAGWLVAVPVPFMLMWGPDWNWVLAANVLLGVSQGLTWSTTVIMKIDLVGPRRRGLAMGLNEFAGYLAVAGSALLTGWCAAEFGLRPEPFYLGVVYVLAGLLLSVSLVRETRQHVALEARSQPAAKGLSQGEIFRRTSLGDRNLSSVSLAGLVNNLNDGMAWGLFPLLFAAAGMTFGQIGVLVAIYPAVWGIGQVFTGAWSDRVGRKWLIVWGMALQAIGIGVTALAGQFTGFALGAVLLGAGTAMVYPTLLAAIGDAAYPTWRASAVGVYRLWRDLGYAVGALLAGLLADWQGLSVTLWVVAALTLLSGLLVAMRMVERRQGSAGGNPIAGKEVAV
ncbi:MFS transporter [Pseudomonas sp. GD03721]|nr:MULTISPECIES: MFS transporter [unclassified Pseudomonas]MDH1443734.1 MFS transporter [Pseudomonas sp. GD03722]WGG03646.1 MFS transporter [Pseudomonas sp. GD03721]WGG07814.1 MFS transporter [Pseudomonas sp. GD03919]